jgi:hypothetical protein
LLRVPFPHHPGPESLSGIWRAASERVAVAADPLIRFAEEGRSVRPGFEPGRRAVDLIVLRKVHPVPAGLSHRR